MVSITISPRYDMPPHSTRSNDRQLSLAIDYSMSAAIYEIRALLSQHPTLRPNGIFTTGHVRRGIEELSEIEETRIEREKCTMEA